MSFKYETRPVVVEAFWPRILPVEKWPAWGTQARKDGMLRVEPRGEDEAYPVVNLTTLQGEVALAWNDWIIQDKAGNLSRCTNEDFREQYVHHFEPGEIPF
jgi:hypothetical protein